MPSPSTAENSHAPSHIHTSNTTTLMHAVEGKGTNPSNWSNLTCFVTLHIRLKAAINFVDLSVQHAAYLAGRGDVEKAIQSTHESLTLGKHFKYTRFIDNSCISHLKDEKVRDVMFYLNLAQPGEGDKKSAEAYSSEALSLTLPGQVLNMSTLVYQKKFRYVGNKTGGLRGWEMLQSAGLGEIHEEKAARGTDKVFRPVLQSWLTPLNMVIYHSYSIIKV